MLAVRVLVGADRREIVAVFTSCDGEDAYSGREVLRRLRDSG
jgi:hypothetical protein